MNILFLTPPPYLPNRLHRIRAFDLIKILAKKHAVHLLTVTSEKTVSDDFKQLKKFCSSTTIIYVNTLRSYLNCLLHPMLPSEVAYCHSKNVSRTIKRFVKKHNIDIIYCKRLRSAIYLNDSNGTIEQWNNTSVIIDTTDAMSMFYYRMFQRGAWYKKLFYFVEYLRYKTYEKKMMQKFPHWVVCSKIDKEYLSAMEQWNNVTIDVIPNPVDTEYFRAKKSGEKNTLLFRGLMDKPVNIDAVHFFVKDIFPHVLRKIPSVRLLIVGPNPHRSIKKFHDGENIFVTGFVNDVREQIEKAQISVCPIRIGAGMRFKIIQSWAMNRPVVSTTAGAEGLTYKDGNDILIADTPHDFARKVIKLMKDNSLQRRLARNGKKNVLKEYSHRAIEKKCRDVFARTLREKVYA